MILINLMKINLLMNSQLPTGKISPVLIWMLTLNLIFFMIKFLSSSTQHLMCHVGSFLSVKLNYPLNPGLPKKCLLRCNIEIRSIRRSLSVIMTLLYKNLRNSVVNKSNYLKNYFLCNRDNNNMRKICSG